MSTTSGSGTFTAADALRDKFGDSSVNLAGALKGRFRERVHEGLTKKPEPNS